MFRIFGVFLGFISLLFLKVFWVFLHIAFWEYEGGKSRGKGMSGGHAKLLLYDLFFCTKFEGLPLFLLCSVHY